MIKPWVDFAVVVYRVFRSIMKMLTGFFSWAGDKIGWLGHKIHHFWDSIPGVSQLGWAVGKTGKYVFGVGSGANAFATAAAPSGGGAIPVSGANQVQRMAVSTAAGNAVPYGLTVHTHIHVDGKKVAEAVSKHRQNQQARK
jgi:hypothetical protein